MVAALARFWLARRGPWLDVLPAALYLVALFWAGLTPLKSLPGPDFALLDKAWHLAGFAGLAVLLARAAVHFGRRPRAAAASGALASAGLGIGLELLQSLTAYRSAELADVIADVLGAGLAYAVLRALAQAAGLASAPAES